jgi:glutaconate CoA-transferase subunit B
LTVPGARKRAGLIGGGPIAVVTDKCIFEFNQDTCEMFVKSIHPGVSAKDVIDATGFEISISPEVEHTSVPKSSELDILRNQIDPEGVYL